MIPTSLAYVNSFAFADAQFISNLRIGGGLPTSLYGQQKRPRGCFYPSFYCMLKVLGKLGVVVSAVAGARAYLSGSICW